MANKHLKDYAVSYTRGPRFSISVPTVEANQFELKPSFISMVQQHQYGGGPMDDPNHHLDNFNDLCSMMHINGDRQKSYADRRRRPLEFSVGDHVFLRVSPTKGVKRFGLRGKLAPRYIGPFEILERIGAVAYRLALPPSLSGVHDVFHVSMLRRYVPDPTHVLADIPVPVQPDITYEEVPVRILDRKERQLRNKTIRLVKVGWQHHSDEEATWELEDTIRARYPH
ncbi:uncharacterized protein LOC122013986, partial [Zingiber officinale]|uniref:uncharacterized protein LOC122013986 n=1 Tax=Zingiber officinale TaxID=94328 RepID=UPI001C4DCA6F